MSKQTTNKLVESSIAASLSAIEVYNKPNFPYRNEVFCILIVNAWELLFKAKILFNNNNNLNSIHVFDSKGNQKFNRNNAPLTIEVYGAMELLKVPETIEKNIASLIDLRDTSIHYVSKQPIDYLVYSLGAACLRNYQKCIKEWFSKDLLEYNFYIMPLGFSHGFKAFKMLELDKEPEEIKRLINAIAENQKAIKPDDDFVFNCEIQINLVSAKKITEDTDLEVSVNPKAKEYIMVEKTQKLTDRYPISSTELWKALHAVIPEMKQTEYYKFLNEKKIRENEKYASYNFRSKKHEDLFKKTGKVSSGTPAIYNTDCLAFMTQEIPKFIKKEMK